MENLIKILLVDDHAMLRFGLKQLLEKCNDMHVIDECADGGEAETWLLDRDCDVILLDIAMPGMNGIDFLRRLNQKKSKRIPVLVISAYPEEQYAIRLIKEGISGYLSKDCPPDEVADAVRNVTSGKMHFSPAVIRMLVNQIHLPDERLPHEILSTREFEVYKLIVSAKTIKEISHITDLSSKTISTYRTRILEKMKLNNNAELMRYASEHHQLIE
jgi:DNA-binding NarL/FixJ family response regulator